MTNKTVGDQTIHLNPTNSDMYPTNTQIKEETDKCLRDYLHRMLSQATFYIAEEGWNALSRVGFADLLLRRNEIESDPNAEVIIGEGAYRSSHIATHCKQYFAMLGQNLTFSRHAANPTIPALEHCFKHEKCNCRVFAVSDNNTETLCTVTRMHRSGIFYVFAFTLIICADSN